MQITLIGAGNIGSSLLEGLLHEGSQNPGDITISDVNLQALEHYRSLGMNTMTDNAGAVLGSSLIFVCVKPWLIEEVLGEIMPSLKPHQILISFAAGVSIDRIAKETGEQPLCRVIPNTAMAVNASMGCIVAAPWTSPDQVSEVQNFLSKVGNTLIMKETELDAATILASCGTAFALRYLRASIEAGVEIGLRPGEATVLAAQSMLGAAKIILEGGGHPEQEIDKVTTPKGSTITGLNAMEKGGFSSALIQGILTANGLYKKN